MAKFRDCNLSRLEKKIIESRVWSYFAVQIFNQYLFTLQHVASWRIMNNSELTNKTKDPLFSFFNNWLQDFQQTDIFLFFFLHWMIFFLIELFYSLQ